MVDWKKQLISVEVNIGHWIEAQVLSQLRHCAWKKEKKKTIRTWRNYFLTTTQFNLWKAYCGFPCSLLFMCLWVWYIQCIAKVLFLVPSASKHIFRQLSTLSFWSQKWYLDRNRWTENVCVLQKPIHKKGFPKQNLRSSRCAKNMEKRCSSIQMPPLLLSLNLKYTENHNTSPEKRSPLLSENISPVCAKPAGLETPSS